MKFSERVSEIQTGDLCLFQGDFSPLRPSTYFAGAIRLRSGTPYTHVGTFVWKTIHGRRALYVAEAMDFTGVRFKRADLYVRECPLWWYQVNDRFIDRDKSAWFWMDHEGIDYASKLQLLRSFGLATNWVCNKLKLPALLDQKRFWCSFGSGLCLLESHYPESYFQEAKRPLERFYPSDLTTLPEIHFKWRLVP